MRYEIWADCLVGAHCAYAAFIVLGLVAILVGTIDKWEWIRNPWFRYLHLLAIVVVALEAVFGIDCPLTLWEASLRRAAGQQVSGESFIGRLLHGTLFIEAPPLVLNALHIGCAIVILSTLMLAPPRALFKMRRSKRFY